MDNTKIFRFEKANIDVRMIEIDNVPYFVLRDVLKAMGSTTPTSRAIDSISDSLGSGVINSHPIVDNMGREQNALVINKSAVTFLVSRSNTSLGKALNRWIHTEVIPAIEQTGRYETSAPAFQIPKTYAEALKVAAEQAEKVEAQAKQLAEQAPKVLFTDSVNASKSSILVADLAKILKQNGVETGRDRLFTWLRENNFLIRRKGSDYNMPTQRSMELGLFEIKQSMVHCPQGKPFLRKTPKVTGKGQVYFINKLLKHYIAPNGQLVITARQST